MGFLQLQKAEAGAHIYLDIKNELIRIYAPKPQDAYNKALSRTMVGLPSQLGYQIINDICTKPVKLEGCCCAGAALAIWSNQLPVNIRAHISNLTFTKETYKSVFEAADRVYNSARQVNAAVAAIQSTNLDETVSAFDRHNQPTEVAATTTAKNKKPNNKGGSGKGKNKKGAGPKKPRGPRHASSPPEECCDRHYVHGDQAWYCLAPLTCPWKDRCTSRQN